MGDAPLYFARFSKLPRNRCTSFCVGSAAHFCDVRFIKLLSWLHNHSASTGPLASPDAAPSAPLSAPDRVYEYGHFLYPFTCPTLGSLFSHSLRAICTVLLDPRDPLLQSERMQGFAADPVYVKGEVFAYVGLRQNLKDLKDLGTYRRPMPRVLTGS